MKRLLVILLMVPFVSMSQGAQGFTMNQPQVTPGFVIKGNIAGLNDGTEVLIKADNNTRAIASGKVTKGSFTLKGKLADPEILRLSFTGHQQALDLFMYNDNITISGDFTNAASIQVKGSAIEDDFLVFQSQFNPLFEKLNQVANLINTGKNPEKRDSMVKEFNTRKSALLNAAARFAKDKPASPVSSLVLFAVTPLFDSPEQLSSLYAQLQPAARKNAFAKEIENKMVGMVGSQAIEFTQKDVDGKPVTLSSFRGKYVLVDFWASWCRPCRAENPNVVSAYQSFRNKNFTVLGVSLDQVRPNWLEAIKADNLTWTHVSDLQYWNNAAAQLYHIQSIPANFLIDPTGKIIARDIRGEELQRKLQEVLK